MKRYIHGPVAWQSDPDFDLSPDGDVVLWVDAKAELEKRDEEIARLTSERDEARAALDTVTDAFRKSTDEWSAQAQTDRAEIARLTEALAAQSIEPNQPRKAAHVTYWRLRAEAAERDRTRYCETAECNLQRALRAEQKLAAAERERDWNAAAWTVQWDRANAAEQKLAAAERVHGIDQERIAVALARVRELEIIRAENDSDNIALRGKLDTADSELAQLREQYTEKHFQWVQRGDELDKLHSEHQHEVRELRKLVSGLDGDLASERDAMFESSQLRKKAESELAQLLERAAKVRANLQEAFPGDQTIKLNMRLLHGQ